VRGDVKTSRILGAYAVLLLAIFALGALATHF
jgi:hypothetical protein